MRWLRDQKISHLRGEFAVQGARNQRGVSGKGGVVERRSEGARQSDVRIAYRNRFRIVYGLRHHLSFSRGTPSRGRHKNVRQILHRKSPVSKYFPPHRVFSGTKFT